MSDTVTWRDEAIALVDASEPESVRKWAIEFQAGRLADEARKRTLAEERRALQASGRKEPLRLHPVALAASQNPAYSKTSGGPVHRILRKLGTSQNVRGNRAKWRLLSDEEKWLAVRAVPAHMSIDHGSPEWLEYAATEEGIHWGVPQWERRQDLRRREKERWEQVARFANEQAIVRWVRELLDSEFSLPDGSRVTWGTATIDDHLERIEMLHKNAVANLEAVTRHEAAVRALTGAGASTLSELEEES